MEVTYRRPPWLTRSYHPRSAGDQRGYIVDEAKKRLEAAAEERLRVTVSPARGRFSALSVPNSKSILYGGFL